ncbi:OmpA family protein [Colwellia sp. MEBiC06753]
MKHIKRSLLTLALIATSSSYAFAQPNAELLTGQIYGGGHYSLFKADDERLKVGGNNASSLDDGDGFGLDLGYRFSVYNELRIQYTDLSIDAHDNNFGKQDGSSVAIDLLHFPSKQNLYLVGGFKNIDLEDKEISANIGMGYRHYFTNRFAAYVEGKGHYQLEDRYKDWTATIGLIYFFGENQPKAAKAVESAKVAPSPAPVEVDNDSDDDGILNHIDQCADTPKSHYVDSVGCTVYTEEVDTMELVILFDNNSDEIKSNFNVELEKTADFLNRYPDVELTIEGHTSIVGTEDYNQKLSERRAKAVVDRLVSDFGINRSRLTAIGYGETQLINPDNTEVAHAENRRIMATMSVKTEKEVVVKPIPSEK